MTALTYRTLGGDQAALPAEEVDDFAAPNETRRPSRGRRASGRGTAPDGPHGVAPRVAGLRGPASSTRS